MTDYFFWYLAAAVVGVIVFYLVVFYAVRNAIIATRPKSPTQQPATSHLDADGL